MPRLHSGAACDRPETNQISKLPPIPEVVWQQPTEMVTNQDNLSNITNESTIKTNVASQTSPPNGTQTQNHVETTEKLQEIRKGMSQYCSLTAPRIILPLPKIQNST